MSLKSTNPTKTNSWNKLRNHFNDIKDIHIDACLLMTSIGLKNSVLAGKTSILIFQKTKLIRDDYFIQ